MSVAVKRVYEEASENDGFRILVDRIWPRGLSREKAEVGEWLKELAPSNELRKWFGHDPAKWEDFRRRYFRELEDRSELIDELIERARGERLTLVFAAKDLTHNNAVALKQYLEDRIHQDGGPGGP